MFTYAGNGSQVEGDIAPELEQSMQIHGNANHFMHAVELIAQGVLLQLSAFRHLVRVKTIMQPKSIQVDCGATWACAIVIIAQIKASHCTCISIELGRLCTKGGDQVSSRKD